MSEKNPNTPEIITSLPFDVESVQVTSPHELITADEVPRVEATPSEPTPIVEKIESVPGLFTSSEEDGSTLSEEMIDSVPGFSASGASKADVPYHGRTVPLPADAAVNPATTFGHPEQQRRLEEQIGRIR